MMEKKYVKLNRPRVPSRSLEQEEHHQQQVDLFSSQENEHKSRSSELDAFNEEMTEQSKNDGQQKKQYSFDPSTGLWLK